MLPHRVDGIEPLEIKLTLGFFRRMAFQANVLQDRPDVGLQLAIQFGKADRQRLIRRKRRGCDGERE